jgi:hypothetical protein
MRDAFTIKTACAPKIRESLARLYPDVHTPAISTVRAVLDRHVATIFSSRTWLTET